MLKKTLERWINQYNHSGINGLSVSHTKQNYSPEFKLSVVQAVKNGQFSAEYACLYFGIANSGIISQWLQAFDKQGINGLSPKPKGHPIMKQKYPKMPPPPKTEEERLRYRILELEAEVHPKKVAGTQPRKKAEIEQKIAEIFQQNNGNYGYHRITLVLRRIWTINHKKVQAIMQKWGLKGKCKCRKYHLYQGEVGKIAENLLQREFRASAPNEKWVTEFKCTEGKRYLSPIKDLFNEEIIAYDLIALRSRLAVSDGQVFEQFANETALSKVCREREIAWIMG